MDKEEDKLHYVAGQLTSIGQTLQKSQNVTTKCTECGRQSTRLSHIHNEEEILLIS